MKNVLMWSGVVVGIAALLVGGFFAFNAYIYNQKQAPAVFEAHGPVTAIDLEPMAYDGPGRIIITSEGKNVVIEVPSMGLAGCAARDNIIDISTIQVGEEIAVGGDINEEGVVIPCRLPQHYLKVTIGQYIDRSLGFGFEYKKGNDGYVLNVPPHGNEEAADFEDAIILTYKPDYDAMQKAEGTEGPPTITILIYRNVKKQSARAWVEANKAVSNITSKVGNVADLDFNHTKGVQYTADGLYKTENLVVTNDAFVYLISGAYADEHSSIRTDFHTMLNTFVFFTPR